MLKGKVILVTGAESAIGSSVAKRFAFEGASLILTSENSDLLISLCNEVKKLGQEPILTNLDLSNPDKILDLRSSLDCTFGKLDAIVSCHFLLEKPSLILDYKPESIERIVRMNFIANWSLINCFDSMLRLSDCGRMIFVELESLKEKSRSSFPAYFAVQTAIDKLVEGYAKSIFNTNIKPNIIAVEDYQAEIDENLSSSFTDLFVRLVYEKNCSSGRKHYLKYT